MAKTKRTIVDRWLEWKLPPRRDREGPSESQLWEAMTEAERRIAQTRLAAEQRYYHR